MSVSHIPAFTIEWGDPVTTIKFDTPVYDNKQFLNIKVDKAAMGALICLASTLAPFMLLSLTMIAAGGVMIHNACRWTSSENMADIHREGRNFFKKLFSAFE